MLRIGVDIGGTFTDFAIWKNSGDGYTAIDSRKIPTSRPDLAEAVKQGIAGIVADLRIPVGAPMLIVHGTTVSTNAIIERSQPPIGLLTTEGFRDILGLARLRLDRPVDLFNSRTVPLVPRENVFAVPGRLLADGTEDTPLDEEAVRSAFKSMQDRGIVGAAVCFINAYRHPTHEARATAIAREEFPGLEVMASHEVWPQQAEYERAVLTLLNVYVKPLMEKYLGEIDGFLRENYPNSRLCVTKSNGGIMSVEEAQRLPVHTLLSGPAAGVTAAQVVGGYMGIDHVLTFDMGGTSADISLVEEGRPSAAGQAVVGDFPLMMPVTAVEAMGAGGGSVVWLDGGIMKVGPRSVGSLPGPACYGLGGTEPTLSDAYLVLGYLPEGGLLGGKVALDREMAVRSFQPICKRLGLDVLDAAESAVNIATSEMLSKTTPFLARLGVSAGDLTLMIFGGAGGIHGPLLADEVGIRRIVVPRIPSVFCAFGGLVSDMLHDGVRSVHGRSLQSADILASFCELASEGRAWLAGQGHDASSDDSRHAYIGEMRYSGQSFPISVDLSSVVEERQGLEATETAFHREHQRLFGYHDACASVSIDALKVRTSAPQSRPAAGPPMPARPAAVPTRHRDIWLGKRSNPMTPIWNWGDLGGDWSCAGPAIIEQDIATILVPQGYLATIDPSGNLEMTKADA